jgi:hypothetical protein
MPIEEEVPVKASPAPEQVKDDGLTVCAVSLVAEMISVVVHEGLGHAVVARSLAALGSGSRLAGKLE